MTAITYDFIKKLEQAGFTQAQVEVLATFTTEAASKPEIAQVETELSNKIERSESRLESKIDQVEKRVERLEGKVDRLEAKMDQQFESLRSLMKWLIGIAIALIPSISIWLSYVPHLAKS